MNIVYNASEIAALINKNPYKTQDEIIHNILCKFKKVENKADLDNFKSISKDDTTKLLDLFYKNSYLNKTQFNDYLEKLNNVKTEDQKLKLDKNIMENITKNCINTSNTNHCLNLQKKIDENIDNVLKNKDNSELKKYLNGHINKKRGIKNEDKIIKEYSKKYNKKITDNNSKLYKIHLFDIEKYKIYICGKIDGIENDELIEVKNRKNRLFTFIPEYEQIQIQIYFKLTGLSTGKLIQNYNEEQSILPINQDDNIWNTIIEELNIVSHKIIELL